MGQKSPLSATPVALSGEIGRLRHRWAQPSGARPDRWKAARPTPMDSLSYRRQPQVSMTVYQTGRPGITRVCHKRGGTRQLAWFALLQSAHFVRELPRGQHPLWQRSALRQLAPKHLLPAVRRKSTSFLRCSRSRQTSGSECRAGSTSPEFWRIRLPGTPIAYVPLFSGGLSVQYDQDRSLR